MEEHSVRTTLISVGLCLAVTATAVSGEPQWNQFMGPDGDGRILGSGLFGDSGAIRLEPRWRRTLGSGYSDVVVDGDRLYTLYSDGTEDFAIALSADTGDTLWRYRIGPTYRGHGGSVDGPVSTPLVNGDAVYGLGPHGQLFALDRETGEEVWRVDLAQSLDAQPPPWGFTSSPIKAAGRVVVEVGGTDGRSVCAFAAATGERVWCAGTGSVSYQSPALVTLAGRSQIVANTDSHVLGLDPETGEELWSQLTSEEGFSAIARSTRLGEDRFLISRRGFYGDFAAFDLIHSDGTWTVSEVWASPEFKSTYQVPVLHDGHLYGYSGQFLTCLEAASGERIWKSRDPGRGRTVLVDDRLVTWGVDGVLHVAPASTTGYDDEATVEVLDAGSYHLPAVGAGRLYVRNLREIAAVDVVASHGRQATGAGPVPPLTAASELGGFIERLVAAEDRSRMLDEFFARHPRTPIIEGEDLVHFVYRGEAEDVAVAGTMAEWGDAMYRVGGTDFYYRTYRVDPAARWEYRFVVDFDNRLADPRNPDPAVGSRGPFSELTMPGWEEPRYLTEPAAGAVGRIEEVEFTSRIIEGKRTLSVYLPAEYTEASGSYPLLVVTDGEEALEYGQMVRALDHLTPETLEPTVVVFVPFLKGDFGIYAESAGDRRRDYVDMLGSELIPFLETRYRLQAGRSSRALMGTGPGAYASLLAGLAFSDRYSAVAAQGLDLRVHLRRDLKQAIADSDGTLDLYLDSCSYEVGAPELETEYQREHGAVVAALEKAGHAVTARSLPAGNGWGTWRAQTGVLLETLQRFRETP